MSINKLELTHLKILKRTLLLLYLPRSFNTVYIHGNRQSEIAYYKSIRPPGLRILIENKRFYFGSQVCPSDVYVLGKFSKFI